MLFGFAGIIISFLEEYLYSNGYLVDEFVAHSITLPDLQIVTIILLIVVGILAAVLTCR
jgi:hypothetical protein